MTLHAGVVRQKKITMMMKKTILEESGGCSLGGLIYTPQDGHTENLPLLVFLHGAGERGSSTEHLLRHAIPRLIESGREYPAVVLCPQCPADRVWDNIPERIMRTIAQASLAYRILPDRIALTGASMGGFGAWMMGMTYRNFFSGIAPVSGGGMAWRAANFASTPVFVVHGALDDAVPVEYARLMEKAFHSKGLRLEMCVLEGMGHNDAIEKAYEDNRLTGWLLAQRRTDFDRVPECMEDLF